MNSCMADSRLDCSVSYGQPQSQVVKPKIKIGKPLDDSNVEGLIVQISRQLVNPNSRQKLPQTSDSKTSKDDDLVENETLIELRRENADLRKQITQLKQKLRDENHQAVQNQGKIVNLALKMQAGENAEKKRNLQYQVDVAGVVQKVALVKQNDKHKQAMYEQKTEYKEKIGTKGDDIRELEVHIQDLNSQISELELEISNLKRELTTQTAENEELQGRLEKSKNAQKLKELEIENKKLSRESKKTKNEHASDAKKHKELTKKFDKYKEVNIKLVNSLKTQLQAKQNQYMEIRLIHDDVERKLTEIRDKKSREKNMADTLKSKKKESSTNTKNCYKTPLCRDAATQTSLQRQD